MLKALVFDFDGVVVDSEPVHFAAMLEVAQTHGATFGYDEYEKELIGFDDRDAFVHILKRWGNPSQAIAPGSPLLAELCKGKQEAFDRIASEGIPTVPGSLALMDEAAAAGFPIAIGSGATRADITLILKQLNRLHLFEHIVTADDVAKSKPHPETYQIVASKLGVDPKQCVVIEDTVAGLTAAIGAGMQTLALTTTTPAEDLHIAGRVVPTLDGIGLQTLKDWYGDG